MTAKNTFGNIHFYSGAIIALFTGLHLSNHLTIYFGAPTYLACMEQIRMVYRNLFVESLLLIAVLLQVFSGLRLYWQIRKGKRKSLAKKIQIYSGLYLSFFLLLHVSAVLSGRIIFDLDTNLYFGAAGLNRFPLYLFFIPYYFLAINAIFTHLASLYYLKRKKKGLAWVLAGSGLLLSIAILYGMWGVEIPDIYYEIYGM